MSQTPALIIQISAPSSKQCWQCCFSHPRSGATLLPPRSSPSVGTHPNVTLCLPVLLPPPLPLFTPSRTASYEHSQSLTCFGTHLMCSSTYSRLVAVRDSLTRDILRPQLPEGQRHKVHPPPLQPLLSQHGLSTDNASKILQQLQKRSRSRSSILCSVFSQDPRRR